MNIKDTIILSLLITHIHLFKIDHIYSIKTSQAISKGIKQQLLDNLDKLVNTTAAQELRKDLQQQNKQDYQMVIIDALTANQIFGIFHLQDPVCDQSGDGYLSGLELRCLNKIWKYYVPLNT